MMQNCLWQWLETSHVVGDRVNVFSGVKADGVQRVSSCCQDIDDDSLHELAALVDQNFIFLNHFQLTTIDHQNLLDCLMLLADDDAFRHFRDTFRHFLALLVRDLDTFLFRRCCIMLLLNFLAGRVTLLIFWRLFFCKASRSEACVIFFGYCFFEILPSLFVPQNMVGFCECDAVELGVASAWLDVLHRVHAEWTADDSEFNTIVVLFDVNVDLACFYCITSSESIRSEPTSAKGLTTPSEAPVTRTFGF